MTKKELIAEVLKTSNVEITNADTTRICDAYIEVIRKRVKKDKRIAISNLGVFSIKKRKARKGRNPQTGEAIKIKASKSVGFRPSANLKSFI